MKEKRNKIILIIVCVMAAVLLFVIGYNWINTILYVSTDDARISADLVKISPMASGKVSDFFIEDGSLVEKDEIVGQLDILNLSGSSIEMSLIRSPISGIVIKTQCTVGEIASAGQTLAYVIDPAALYLMANIEENKMASLRNGQTVDIKLDQFKGVHFSGQVENLGVAANSIFSLLPVSSGSSFTKVVQKIPVRISLSYEGYQLIPGTNASVKIHVR